MNRIKAKYVDVQATIDQSSRRISVSARAINNGRNPWPAGSRPDAAQVLDADSDLPVFSLDGAPTKSATAPGESLELSVASDLPAEAGRYRILVSPSDAEPSTGLILVEAQVDDNGLATVEAESISHTRLSWRRFRRSLGRAFTYPWRTILDNPSLIATMVKRDIAGRYAGSFGGAFWTVIQPILLMAVYSFVFGVILNGRFGDSDDPTNYVVYFLAGLLPWLAISEAVGRAPTVIIEYANFVKKLVFPVSVLPVNLVASGLFSQVLALGVFLLLMLAFGRELTLTVLWVPILLVPQVLLSLGLSWFLAALGVVFRDLGQLIGFILTLWFFTTPICYAESNLEGYLWIFDKNPMYVLVGAYRAVLIEGVAPDLVPLGILTAGSFASVILGHAWFHRMKPSFPDLV